MYLRIQNSARDIIKSVNEDQNILFDNGKISQLLDLVILELINLKKFFAQIDGMMLTSQAALLLGDMML